MALAHPNILNPNITIAPKQARVEHFVRTGDGELYIIEVLEPAQCQFPGLGIISIEGLIELRGMIQRGISHYNGQKNEIATQAFQADPSDLNAIKLICRGLDVEIDPNLNSLLRVIGAIDKELAKLQSNCEIRLISRKTLMEA